MRFYRKSNCSACPLDGELVHGKGPEAPHTAIIGGSPTYEEKTQKEPFVGRGGKFLWKTLYTIKYPVEGIYKTNALPCMMRSNAYTAESLIAVEACQKGFWDEIKFLQKTVKIFIALGEVAMKSFKIKGSLQENRGSLFQVQIPGGDVILVLPTYHPSHLFKIRLKGNIDAHLIFQFDLKKAMQVLEPGWEISKEDFTYAPSPGEFENLVNHHIKKKTLIACDIETIGIDHKKAKIVCVGLGFDGNTGVCIPFLRKKGELAYPHNGDRRRIMASLGKLFIEASLAFQNCFFDVPILRNHGFIIPYKNIVHDTLLLHHALYSELPHNLGFITSMYGLTPYWKKEFKERNIHILEMEESDLCSYNLRDCVVLHQVIPPMLKELKELELEKVYFEEAIPMIKPIMLMNTTGVYYNATGMEKWKKYLNKNLKEAIQNIRKLGIPKEFNLNSDEELRWLFFGDRPNTFNKILPEELFIEKDYTKYVCGDCKKLRWIETPKEGKNYFCLKCESILPLTKTTLTKRKSDKKNGSLIHLDSQRLQVVSELIPFSTIIKYGGRKTPSGKRGVGKDSRLGFFLKIQSRLNVLENLKRRTAIHAKEYENLFRIRTFLDEFGKYATYKKLQSTYTAYDVKNDNRIYTTFLEHGTATRRLSSKNPNLMNLPKKEKLGRAPFAASPGHILLSPDYSNLEVRVLAYFTKDQIFMDIFKNGGNIHDNNTKILFGIDETSPNWTLARRAAKIFFFGGISYGGGDREIHGKVTLEAPKLGLILAQYKEAVKNYMDHHPWYLSYKEATIKEAVEKRIARDPFGRKRILFGSSRDIQKEALNYRIQAGASYVINMATIRIIERMEGMKSKLILQVHDQLIVDTAFEEINKVYAILVEEMEKPVKIHEMNVSFPVDMEVGPNWYELKNWEDWINTPEGAKWKS